MTNREAHELRQGLEEVSDLPGAKFAYAVSKNKDKIDRDFKHLRKVLENEKVQEFQEKQNEIFQDLEQKREEIYSKYAKKNKDGHPLYNKYKDENDKVKIEWDIPEESMEAKKQEEQELLDEMDPQGQIEKLKEEYKETFEEFDKQKKEFQQLMEEESSVELHTISEDQLPDGITSKQMDAILPIVESKSD